MSGQLYQNDIFFIEILILSHMVFTSLLYLQWEKIDYQQFLLQDQIKVFWSKLRITLFGKSVAMAELFRSMNELNGTRYLNSL